MQTSEEQPKKTIRDSVQVVSVGAPFIWLSKGWEDYVHTPWLSMFHGMLYTFIGLGLAVLFQVSGEPYLIYPATSAFIFGGPFLALGMYDVSRHYEQGHNARLGRCLSAWRFNSYHILFSGLVFVLFALLWSRFAIIIFALSFPYSGMNLGVFIDQMLFTYDGLFFLITGSIIGGIMTFFAFVFGVVTLPLMLDRKIDVFTAGYVSFWVVMRNKFVMATWAGLIVIFIGAGFVTAYIGLIVTLPLIGFSSWHAYRACVDPSLWPQSPIE